MTTLAGLMLISALIISTLAYYFYYRDIISKDLHPNRWSWFIWSVTTLVEAVTYEALNQDFFISSIFFVSAIFCIAITVRVWKKSVWETPTLSEILSVLAAAVALVVWLVYKQTLAGHLISVLALPIAFIPTWQAAWKMPKHEQSIAWKLWTIGDAATLVLVLLRFESADQLPYVLVECLCHGLVWLLVSYRIRALRT